MKAIAECPPDLPSTLRNSSPQGTRIPADLAIVCLWAAFGTAVTALLFALGFGADIGEILAMAG